MSGETVNKKFKRMSESDRSTEYDHATQKALEEIDLIQNQLDGINEKASEEVLQIEIKYNRLRKPHIEKRSQLISNIPNFWATAIMNHPDISNLFTSQEDEDCLHHLTKLEIEEFENILGFQIKFYFDENPYFHNPVLTKEYIFDSDAPTSKSTPINWKDGVHLGQSLQDSGSKAGKKRHFEATRTSFFTWFSDNVDAYTDNVAEDFKDDLWVNPIQYFLVADGQEDENGVEGEEDSSSEENDDPLDSENPSGSGSTSNITAH